MSRHDEHEVDNDEETGIYRGGVFALDEDGDPVKVIIDVKTVFADSITTARNQLLIEAAKKEEQLDASRILVKVASF